MGTKAGSIISCVTSIFSTGQSGAVGAGEEKSTATRLAFSHASKFYFHYKTLHELFVTQTDFSLIVKFWITSACCLFSSGILIFFLNHLI